MPWLLLVLVIVALVTVGFISYRSRNASSKIPAPPSFTPNPENDKVILVSGWDDTEIRKVIADFVQTYENGGYPAYSIEPQKQSQHFHRLTFPQDIHPQLFMFLVNYLAYPFNFDLTKRSLVIGGRTTLTSDFEIDPVLVGQKLVNGSE